MEELRLYAFNHYKLTGIHAGIQTQHSCQEMNNKFNPDISVFDERKAKILLDWATASKTTIILNGGNSEKLRGIKDLIRNSDYPYGIFHESQEDMEGMLTNVCVVLPERVFNYTRNKPEGHERISLFQYNNKFTMCEREIGELIELCRLMN